MKTSNSKVTNQNILITGGAGFIASYLIEHLVEDNHITVYDNHARNALKWCKVKKHKNLKQIRGDVLNAKSLSLAAKNKDIIIHCAAIAGIYSVVKSPSLTLRVNFLGTYNALEAAKKHGVKKFIDFSTSEVYGPFVYKGKESSSTTQGPIGEDRWAYAVSKLAAEHLTHAYGKESGFPIVTIRPFNVYGPRQVGEGAVRSMTLSAINNQPITIYNDGTQIRAWCYVEDFVDGVIKSIHNSNSGGEAFNIGNPQGSVSNIKLAHTIIRLANSKSKIIFKKHPGPEVEIRIPSIEKAQKILKFKPRIGLEEGILKTIEWYKNHGSLS